MTSSDNVKFELNKNKATTNGDNREDLEIKTHSNQLDKLRELLKENPKIHPCTDNDFLLRFLRLHNYDPEESKKQIFAYYQTRVDFHTVLSVARARLLSVYERGIIDVLPELDHEGCIILLFCVDKWIASDFNPDDIMATLTTTCDWASATPESQLNGMKMIMDNTGFSWAHLKQIRPRHLKLAAKILQQYLPVQFKRVHAVNPNLMFNTLFTWFKPLLGAAFVQKMVVNNITYDQLLADVDRKLVPVAYGGLNPGPFPGVDFLNMFINAQEWLDYYNNFGIKKGN